MVHFDTIGSLFKNLIKCERGTTALEYGFIGVLVSTSVIAGAGAIGSSNVVTMETIASVWPG